MYCCVGAFAQLGMELAGVQSFEGGSHVEYLLQLLERAGVSLVHWRERCQSRGRCGFSPELLLALQQENIAGTDELFGDVEDRASRGCRGCCYLRIRAVLHCSHMGRKDRKWVPADLPVSAS